MPQHTEHTQDTLLVTGAAGQLGRAVLQYLEQSGAASVVAGSRNPDKIRDLINDRITARAVDFDQPAQLEQAFAGVQRLLLISTDEIGTPGKRIAQHRNALEAAARAGVRHVVYTSAPAPLPSPQGGVLDDHFWTEAALFAQPYTWTVLRNELYTDLISMSLPAVLASGQIFSATAGRGRAYVTREDCARAAAAALLHAEGRRVYDITGPAAITQNDLAGLLQQLYGKPTAHVDVPPAALLEGMRHAGLPEALAQALVDFDNSAAQGYHGVVTSSVEELTGQAPTTVEAYLQAAKHS